MSDTPETKESNTPPARRTRSKTKTAAQLQPPSDANVTSSQYRTSDTRDGEADVSEEADDLAALARQVGQMADDPRIEQRLIASYFAGPVPPAPDMAQYKEVMPELPERIMALSERQQRQAEAEAEHRRLLQRMSLESKIRLAQRGQFIGSLIIFADFGLAAYALVTGQAGAAALFGLPGLALVLFIFYGGTELSKRSGLQQAAAWKDALEQFWPRRTASGSNDESEG